MRVVSPGSHGSPPPTDRAAHFHGVLSRRDRERFDALVAEAPTPVHREALWKGLAAAHPLDELVSFAACIAPFYEEELAQSLNLRNLTQQLGMSCEVSSAQVIEAERDPLYALQVRLANPDIHRVVPTDAYAANWPLASEQRVWLERFGGRASARSSQSGGAIWPDRSHELWDTQTARTGLVFEEHRKLGGGETLPKLLEDLCAQVARGIPTPIRVDSPPGDDGGSHCAVVLEVRGEGEGRVLDVYDSWRGGVVEVSWAELLRNELPLRPWSRLVGFRPGREVVEGEAFATDVPPELRSLPPAPPPIKPDVGPNGNVRGYLRPLQARDAEGDFLQWVYPHFEYDWRGQPVVGSRTYVDADGNPVQGIAFVTKVDGSSTQPR